MSIHPIARLDLARSREINRHVNRLEREALSPEERLATAQRLLKMNLLLEHDGTDPEFWSNQTLRAAFPTEDRTTDAMKPALLELLRSAYRTAGGVAGLSPEAIANLQILAHLGRSDASLADEVKSLLSRDLTSPNPPRDRVLHCVLSRMLRNLNGVRHH